MPTGMDYRITSPHGGMGGRFLSGNDSVIHTKGNPAIQSRVDGQASDKTTREPIEKGFEAGEDLASKQLVLREEGYHVSQDINVLALVKGAERYVFLYDDTSRAETLRTLGRYASNPELSFTWYDAAVLSQKIRQDSHKFVSTSRFAVPLPD